MKDEQLIALARKHGAECETVFGFTYPTFTLSNLRSLLQAVHDAAIEHAYREIHRALINHRKVEDWFVRKGLERAANDIRNLKGTLPDMEG